MNESLLPTCIADPCPSMAICWFPTAPSLDSFHGYWPLQIRKTPQEIVFWRFTEPVVQPSQFGTCQTRQIHTLSHSVYSRYQETLWHRHDKNKCDKTTAKITQSNWNKILQNFFYLFFYLIFFSFLPLSALITVTGFYRNEMT